MSSWLHWRSTHGETIPVLQLVRRDGSVGVLGRSLWPADPTRGADRDVVVSCAAGGSGKQRLWPVQLCTKRLLQAGRAARLFSILWCLSQLTSIVSVVLRWGLVQVVPFMAHPPPNPEQKDRLPWLRWQRCSFPVPWASGLCILWRVWGCACEEAVCVDSPNALISSEGTMPLLSRRLLWDLAWKSASRGWKLRASVGCKLIWFLWAWSVFSQPYLAWLWWRGYRVPPELLWAFDIQLCAGLSDVQGEQVPFPCLPPFFGFLCASKLILLTNPPPP